MEQRGTKNKMEAITAYSTLALSALTLVLVILAAVNFQKFIENVNLAAKGLEKQANSIELQAKSLEAQTKSIDLQAEGIKTQTKSIDLQAEAIKAQTKSIDLQAQSLNAQTESVGLQSKDILLNYKPVVFIKEVVQPADPRAMSAYKFILTNSGKLTARNVKVSVSANIVGKPVVTDYHSILVQKASIYPGTDLIFQMNSVVSRVDKAQYRFRISYAADGLPQDMREDMNYIFTDQTGLNLVYVPPTVDIFFNEKLILKMSQYPDLADVVISEGRQRILRQIVDDIIGVDKVLKLDTDELTTLFSTVCKEIRAMKHADLNEGGLTGLRYISRKPGSQRDWRDNVGIIDNNDRLTSIGVSVLKRVAETMKSDAIELLPIINISIPSDL